MFKTIYKSVFCTFFIVGCSDIGSYSGIDKNTTENKIRASNTNEGVANLPFSRGRVFYTLDEYLEYRKELFKSDISYFLEVETDKYQLVTARSPNPKQLTYYTREELELKFKFEK